MDYLALGVLLGLFFAEIVITFGELRSGGR
jgi:hypothetical protein